MLLLHVITQFYGMLERVRVEIFRTYQGIGRHALKFGVFLDSAYSLRV